MPSVGFCTNKSRTHYTTSPKVYRAKGRPKRQEQQQLIIVQRSNSSHIKKVCNPIVKARKCTVLLCFLTWFIVLLYCVPEVQVFGVLQTSIDELFKLAIDFRHKLRERKLLRKGKLEGSKIKTGF